MQARQGGMRGLAFQESQTAPVTHGAEMHTATGVKIEVSVAWSGVSASATTMNVRNGPKESREAIDLRRIEISAG